MISITTGEDVLRLKENTKDLGLWQWCADRTLARCRESAAVSGLRSWGENTGHVGEAVTAAGQRVDGDNWVQGTPISFFLFHFCNFYH